MDRNVHAINRSLATVVIHEIAHSWTGNLVTNQVSWQHTLNNRLSVLGSSITRLYPSGYGSEGLL